MTPSSIAKRRSTDARGALRTGALLLALLPAAATLASCGFDYPTDRVNTIAAGVNERATSVDALGIRILATGQGEGRLIGSLANNNADSASLQQVSSPEGKVEAPGFTPVEVGAGALVNLADQPAISLSGDFTAGQVVPLDLRFSTGESARLRVPVVKPCYQYTKVPSASAPTDAASAEAPDTEGEALDEAAGESTDEAHAESTEDASFNCSDQAPAPEGEH